MGDSKQKTGGRRRDVHGTSSVAEEVDARFTQCDDGSGELPVSKVRKLCGLLGLKLNNKMVQAAFREMDTDLSGLVSRTEFHTWWTQSVQDPAGKFNQFTAELAASKQRRREAREAAGAVSACEETVKLPTSETGSETVSDITTRRYRTTKPYKRESPHRAERQVRRSYQMQVKKAEGLPSIPSAEPPFNPSAPAAVGDFDPDRVARARARARGRARAWARTNHVAIKPKSARHTSAAKPRRGALSSQEVEYFKKYGHFPSVYSRRGNEAPSQRAVTGGTAPAAAANSIAPTATLAEACDVSKLSETQYLKVETSVWDGHTFRHQGGFRNALSDRSHYRGAIGATTTTAPAPEQHFGDLPSGNAARMTAGVSNSRVLGERLSKAEREERQLELGQGPSLLWRTERWRERFAEREGRAFPGDDSLVEHLKSERRQQLQLCCENGQGPVGMELRQWQQVSYSFSAGSTITL